METKTKKTICKLKMNDSVVNILIDSGSGSNVIDETTLKALKVQRFMHLIANEQYQSLVSSKHG